MVENPPEMKNAGEAMPSSGVVQEFRSAAASWTPVYGMLPSDSV
jgi:hypothetical protein